MSGVDATYGDLIDGVLTRGERVTTRGATCLRTFGERVEFRSTPLVSARKTAWRNALREMEWVLSGSSNINDLHRDVRPWWQPWADGAGLVWCNYGMQLRHWGTDFDQIEYLIGGVVAHPFSRRNAVTTWNTEDMADPGTPITNCWGTVIQAFVDGEGRLHLVTYQRSADVMCGLPHNWIQMWAFLLWLARRTGRGVGSLVWLGGDVHVYLSHLDLAGRVRDVCRDQTPATPELLYEPTSEAFLADDFSLGGEYVPVLTDRAEMVV